jgi:hypothetical protein
LLPQNYFEEAGCGVPEILFFCKCQHHETIRIPLKTIVIASTVLSYVLSGKKEKHERMKEREHNKLRTMTLIADVSAMWYASPVLVQVALAGAHATVHVCVSVLRCECPLDQL